MGEEKEESVSAAQFLETFPLFRKVNVGEDFQYLPSKISLPCVRCEKETTWALRSDQPNSFWIYWTGTYSCVLCEKEYIRFYLRRDAQKREMMKVGQHPEPSIAIPKPLEKSLKNYAQPYRKGLISFDQSYGMQTASCVRLL